MRLVCGGELLEKIDMSFRQFRQLARRHKWKYQSFEEGELVFIDEVTKVDILR